MNQILTLFIVKCSNSISYKNPYEISVTQTIWQSLDYFLYYMSLPPSQQRFEHATIKEVIQHTIVVVISFGYIVGQLYSLLLYSGNLCVVSCIVTIGYTFLHLVQSKKFDVDVSFYPNLQKDDGWKMWVYKEVAFSVVAILKQMIPFFIIVYISSLLFGFFVSFLQVICFVIVPITVHIVFTDLFIRLFLSQHVNLNYYSPQVSIFFF